MKYGKRRCLNEMRQKSQEHLTARDGARDKHGFWFFSVNLKYCFLII